MQFAMPGGPSPSGRSVDPATVWIAGGWCVAAALLTVELPGSVSAWIDDLAQLMAAGLATSCALVAARRSTQQVRQAWWALTVASGSWFGGQVVWSLLELGGKSTPFPSLADVGYLIFPAATTVAVVALPAGRARLRGRDVVDGFIIALALTAVSWAAALGTVVTTGGQSLPTRLVSMAYPITDIILVTMALLATARARRQRRTLAALAAAATGMAVSDGSFTYLTATGGYASGNPLGLGWIAAFLLISWAALLESRDHGRPPTQEEAPTAAAQCARLVFLPYLPLATAGLGALWCWVREVQPPAGTWTLLLLAVLLTLVRQFVTLWDNRALTAEVAARTADLDHRASRDQLTGLVNRAVFTERVTEALARHARDRTALAVLFCDLNDFKGVNDGLGHAAGDELLTAVAARLARTLRTGDTLARLGGDEFAVLIRAARTPRRAPGVGTVPVATAPECELVDVVGARAIAERLLRTIAPSVLIAGTPVSVGMSVGVACVAATDVTPTTDHVLSRADIAMYTSKRSTTPRPVVYRAGLALPESSDWRLRPSLEQAVRNGNVVAHYQPIVELATGALHGFEALARWRRGEHYSHPAEFLPVATRAGLMPALTDHMLRTASAQLGEWTARRGLGHLRMAVNVSPAQIIDPGFAATVRAVLDDYDVPVGGLVVEITEEALLTDLDTAVEVADNLRSLGVLLSLDDFGAGYSSLAHLHRLPLDKLKLDRAFVQNVDTDADLRRLLSGLLALSNDLGLTVIAEGIEREAQTQVLQDLGCTIGQGFLFAAAAPAGECDELLTRRASRGGAVRRGRHSLVPSARSA